MPNCRVCKKQFRYDDEVGYDRELCGPLCDGIETGVARSQQTVDDVAWAMDFIRNGAPEACGLGDCYDLRTAVKTLMIIAWNSVTGGKAKGAEHGT